MNVTTDQLFSIIGQLYVENILLKTAPQIEQPERTFEPLDDDTINQLKGILDG